MPCGAMAVKPLTWINLPKAIWGFNGTERPALLTLQRLWQLTARKASGISIYGHDVQDADDTSIPADVEEKLRRLARARFGRRQHEGTSHPSLGGVSTASPVPSSITTSSILAGNESPGGGYDRTASPYRSEDLRRSRTGNGTGLG
ncbi:hypothetical protein ACNKHV_17525 [Shigella flexneri]